MKNNKSETTTKKKLAYVPPVAVVKDVKVEQNYLQSTGSGDTTLPPGAGDGGEF